MANNDIAYINKKMTEAYDILGGNTAEYRLWVSETLGIDIGQYKTHNSAHVNESASGNLKLLNNTAANEKHSTKLRDIANSMRADPAGNKEKLAELKESRDFHDMMTEIMDIMYNFMGENDEPPEEMDPDLYEDIQDLFYKAGKPTNEDILDAYNRYQQYLTGITPPELSTTVENPVEIPDEPQ